MSLIKDLLTQLVSYQSITPQDNGCQDYMIDFFTQHGFECQRFDKAPVSNFFARFGQQAPLLIFAGHTDVVPVGDLQQWQTQPFVLQEKNGLLYGRGTADMKGSLAAMMSMAASFVKTYPHFSGSLAFLITSGEEGDDFAHGTPHVMQALQQLGIHPQFCLVGEPSSSHTLGDVIKIGRRGSLTGKLHLVGKQGHVAYPQFAKNPIHLLSPILHELTTTQWDEGNHYFPPTSLQITHIQAGGQANNLIPGELTLHFNFRYSTEQTAEGLKEAVKSCFTRHGLHPSIQWQLNGEPFLTSKGKLLASTLKAIEQITGQTAECSTSGGTSDGRFIAPYGVEVVELGPINATIHQANECVALADLEKLSQIYFNLCEQLLL